MGEIMDIKQGTYFSNGKTYKHRGEDAEYNSRNKM